MGDIVEELRELMDYYWNVAITQGWERRETDDEDGSAQKADDALVEYVRALERDRNYWKIEAEGEASKVDFRDKELTRLRAENAAIRGKAIEEAARYHEDAVALIRHDPCSYKNGRMRPTSRRASDVHEASAAVIRKLKEKAE